MTDRRRGLSRVFSFRSADHVLMSGNHFFALVDGIYAVIATLLVLELHVPDEVEPGKLLHDLLELKESFGAFAVGFLQSYAGWSTFHRLSQRVRGVDQWMIIIFGLALAVASLVPFSTAVLAGSFDDSDNFRTAVQFVTLIGTVSSGLFLLGTGYAFRRGFAAPGTTDEQIRFGARLGGVSMIGWAAALLVTLVSPWAALPMVVWGYAIALLPLRIEEFPVVAGGAET